ncbi:MAG: aminotransferase [Burkholderiales bacterium]
MIPSPAPFAPDSPAARDVAYHLHACTNLRQHERDGPLVIERGEGIYVWDSAGKRYIEGMSGLWCTTLGFSEPRLCDAADRQMRKLPFNSTFRGRSHEALIDLAERLIARAPVPMSKAFFASSGSEANDTAIKMVAYYHHATGRPGKRRIVARRKGYHGTTIATAAITGLDDYHTYFNLPANDVLFVDTPHHWRHARPAESEEAYAARLAADLERAIVEAGPETIGAFIAEPVMGVGAVLVPPRTYFERVQEVLRRHDVLMIADEVICGFGRTGAWWGSQTFGIRPDIVTCAKGLSSAYLPISAVLVTDRVYGPIADASERVGIFGHGHTYSGHPVCAAVALEALKIYEERDIPGHVRAVSPRFLAGLRGLAASPIVGEARGVGLMGAIEFVVDKASKSPFDKSAKVGARVAARALEHGLFVRAIGDSVVSAPPLVITESQIDDLIGRLAQALADVERELARSAT